MSTYLNYGIDIELSNKLKSLGLPKTTFEKTSYKNLLDKYKLTEDEIRQIKNAITRQPIEPEVIDALLNNSNYTCCACRGTKGDSYIIHHIVEHSKTQDNTYNNLAVLCPTCHDLAHRKGPGLTMKLTPNQIVKAKKRWEKFVQSQNLERAARTGNIHEIDFINYPRILELYTELFKELPQTQYSDYLTIEGFLDIAGSVNPKQLETSNINLQAPLRFHSCQGSTAIIQHYYEAFKRIINHLNFVDLDTILNSSSVKTGIVGKYCCYVGGLYCKSLTKRMEAASEVFVFHFVKKGFQGKFLADSKFFCSNSSLCRTSERGKYMVFGKVRNVDFAVNKKREKNHYFRYKTVLHGPT
ncbi:HNH endonuclease signature motif containing protein [Niabella insulamsoli]|uniref:HNH endonuclease signature motif containing protein n=1 Tax=Niabella insulamsoli TaxID=3144874 RepID=UPI0031FC65A2